MAAEWIARGLAGVLGVCIGSFLNVCIHRLPEGDSVVSPGSHCPDCGAPIRWRDNVPLLSYILLRGRCRACGERISPQYPLVELATGVIWMAAVARHGVAWPALTVAVFFTLLLGIALTDARTFTIPDEFTLGGAAIGLLLSLAPGGISFGESLVGAVVGFGILYLAAVLGEWWLDKPAMGGGDIKMMAMIGAFLGPIGAILAIFLGALIGSVVFLPLAIRRHTLIPFGVFLAIGAALAEGWGDLIVGWYAANFLTL